MKLHSAATQCDGKRNKGSAVQPSTSRELQRVFLQRVDEQQANRALEKSKFQAFWGCCATHMALQHHYQGLIRSCVLWCLPLINIRDFLSCAVLRRL